MEDSYVLELLESKFKEFYLCFCGYAQCEPMHHYGPASRPNYIIHYILDGKGVYQVGEKKFYLSKGQGFLIEPETLTFYQADQEEPWTYLWIGFSGNNAKGLVRDLGLNKNQLIYQCSKGEELKNVVLSMLKRTKATTSNLYFLQSKLFEFFSILAEDIMVDVYIDTAKENLYVQQAISFIRNRYSEGITVIDVANYLSVNRSYLYTIFKNQLELSPKDFLTKFRISRAKEQLALTESSIEEIAFSCGYQSALTFTRAFKKEIGIPPREYRRKKVDSKKNLITSPIELDKVRKNGKSVVRLNQE